jgi:hypothetical protein
VGEGSLGREPQGGLRFRGGARLGALVVPHDEYGTPVPGKTDLVTSPFASDSGYVDVTGFPPATAVEDPYTGKIFLTP